MTGLSLARIILFVAIIDIVFIMAAGFSGIDLSNAGLTILSDYIDYDTDTNTTDVDPDLMYNLGVDTNQSGSTIKVGLLTVIFSTLGFVWGVIILIASYVLAPIAYMKAIGAPFYAILLVGAPIVIQFIRGRNM